MIELCLCSSRRGEGACSRLNKTASPCLIAKQRRTPFARSFAISVNFSFFVLSCLVLAVLRLHVCLSVVSLTVFMLCLVSFLLCMCCSLASVSNFSPLRSRSHSQEGDEHLGGVLEEEEAGGRGREGERRAGNEGRSQAEGEGSVGRVDSEEHQEDLVEDEEDVHQRSVSETDLR